MSLVCHTIAVNKTALVLRLPKKETETPNMRTIIASPDNYTNCGCVKARILDCGTLVALQGLGSGDTISIVLCNAAHSL